MGIKTFVCRRIIIYPTISILMYLVSKYFFPTEAEKFERDRLKNSPENIIIQDPKDTRGGFLKPKQFLEKLFKNEAKHILVAVLALCGMTVADRYRSVVAEIVTGASPAITALPLPLARRLLEGLQSFNPKEILEALKEGLLSKELTIEEKLLLLKKSLQALLISANNTRARRSLLLTALLVILGTALTNGPLFGGAMLVFQDLFTKVGFKRGTVKFIVDIYNEYNTPIPLELYELMKEIKLVPGVENI